ncbi:MAG: fatty acid desaturase [Acidimicrobiales bacterium]
MEQRSDAVTADDATTAWVEWPTLILAVAIYGSWLAVVLGHRYLAWWAIVPLLAIIVAWHGSLQHELLHGHPFRSRRANTALASVPLGVRLSYEVYRRDHLRHHSDEILTDPRADIESYYMTADSWQRMSGVGRALVMFHQTLLGRLLIGPLMADFVVWRDQLREIRAGDRRVALWLARHLLLATILLVFVFAVAGVPVWIYLLGAVYLGHSLSLVRSYCEHRWVPGDATKSAVVRAGPFFGLLFLHNNIHHAHHAKPRAAWYTLPALSVSIGSDDAARAGAGFYKGYWRVFARYLVRPFDHPVHPMERAQL